MIIRKTSSVCPVCLRRLDAEKHEREDGIYIVRDCPEHGHFETVVWRNRVGFADWTGEMPETGAIDGLSCPHGCGLCPDHMRDTCCILLEVTDRCNLNCRYCFADNHQTADAGTDVIKARILDLTKPGKTLLQLSGGEPTVRDDLPELIRCAKDCGCRYVQLNTNGLRLAEEPGYAKLLADAGLSFVFLQFDSTGDRTWQKLRGRPLADIKERCVQACAEAGLGVTLVPTLVPGVNTNELRDIVEFGIKHSPTVRGVHFQPAAYMGHTPVPEDKDRFTLDELIFELDRQLEGLMTMEDIAPSSCDHPLCGFHGDFIVTPDKKGLIPLTKKRRGDSDAECTDNGVSPADANREYVGRRWERRAALEDCCCGTQVDITSFDGFLRMHRTYGFTLTAMAFQDAGNLDIERLRRCSLHVYDDGRIVPFCAKYLTPIALPEDR